MPEGVKGELYIGGAGVAQGYWRRDDLTSERFVPDRFRPGHRMYRTGDLARWLSDGRVEFCGRTDDQVKIRGYRIEPGEITRHLLGYAGIREAAVVVKERGGDRFLSAYYVSEGEIGVGQLKAYLSGRLPEYMLPLAYMWLARLPLTVSGKLDRKALPEPGVPEGGGYEGPSNETEDRLAELWSDVLRLDKDKISVTANFFELGGHSLKATVLSNRIEKELNVTVSIRDIFMKATIRQQAELIQISEWLKNDTVSTENKGKIEVII